MRFTNYLSIPLLIAVIASLAWLSGGIEPSPGLATATRLRRVADAVARGDLKTAESTLAESRIDPEIRVALDELVASRNPDPKAFAALAARCEREIAGIEVRLETDRLRTNRTIRGQAWALVLVSAILAVTTLLRRPPTAPMNRPDEPARRSDDATIHKLIAYEREVRRLQAELTNERVESWTEPLTGLLIRRVGRAKLCRQIEQDCDSPLHLLFCDLDLFKDLNTRYGHAGGDEALRSFGRLVKRTLRDRDFAYREGGEEFVVVMPETDEATAVERIAALERELHSLKIVVPGPNGEPQTVESGLFPGVSLTFSGGLAELREPLIHATTRERLKARNYADHDGEISQAAEELAEELIKLADDRAYESKRNGRNRTTGKERKCISHALTKRHRM